MQLMMDLLQVVFDIQFMCQNWIKDKWLQDFKQFFCFYW